ncbi:hypothetical protein HYV81_06550 [Candidatus Woesearchaeota archaeon]|nr:hypothetical protein [Candidatus Woesearchaeota archaeon]
MTLSKSLGIAALTILAFTGHGNAALKDYRVQKSKAYITGMGGKCIEIQDLEVHIFHYNPQGFLERIEAVPYQARDYKEMVAIVALPECDRLGGLRVK